PDTAQGNDGPGAFAIIRDGTFRTASQLGTIAGPHALRITGFDAPPLRDEAPPPGASIRKRLFTDYEISLNFPASFSKHEIDIPKKKKGSGEPRPQPPSEARYYPTPDGVRLAEPPTHISSKPIFNFSAPWTRRSQRGEMGRFTVMRKSDKGLKNGRT